MVACDASRSMESTSKPNCIHLSDSSRRVLTQAEKLDDNVEAVSLVYRGNLTVKGKGTMVTFWLLGYHAERLPCGRDEDGNEVVGSSGGRLFSPQRKSLPMTQEVPQGSGGGESSPVDGGDGRRKTDGETADHVGAVGAVGKGRLPGGDQGRSTRSLSQPQPTLQPTPAPAPLTAALSGALQPGDIIDPADCGQAGLQLVLGAEAAQKARWWARRESFVDTAEKKRRSSVPPMRESEEQAGC